MLEKIQNFNWTPRKKILLISIAFILIILIIVVSFYFYTKNNPQISSPSAEEIISNEIAASPRDKQKIIDEVSSTIEGDTQLAFEYLALAEQKGNIENLFSMTFTSGQFITLDEAGDRQLCISGEHILTSDETDSNRKVGDKIYYFYFIKSDGSVEKADPAILYYFESITEEDYWTDLSNEYGETPDKWEEEDFAKALFYYAEYMCLEHTDTIDFDALNSTLGNYCEKLS